MNLDAPEDRVHTALSRAVFGDHPLGREVLGEMATVEAITRDDIADVLPTAGTARRRWSSRRPAGSTTTQVVDGGGGGPRRRRRRRAARRARRPRPPAERVVVERDDTEQAHLCLGWRSLSTGDDDRWALSVANQVLGGGHVEPAVPGGPRGARPRVLRVLAPHRLRGLRLPHDLLRHRAQAGPRGARGDRRRRGRRCWPTASPSASWPSRPATSRARCCSGSRTAAAAWVGSAAA